MSTSLYRNCSATDGPAKKLARFVETKLRASWANPLWCRFIARRQPGKLFRAALLEGASGRFARAGEAVHTPVRYLSVLAFSTASRTEGWQVDARAATGAGPALR